ncbi:unnamed protein product [Lathyrus sativus]|nr:unnamed protein product [Lathyrus sativus]
MLLEEEKNQLLVHLKHILNAGSVCFLESFVYIDQQWLTFLVLLYRATCFGGPVSFSWHLQQQNVVVFWWSCFFLVASAVSSCFVLVVLFFSAAAKSVSGSKSSCDTSAVLP